MKPLGIAAMFKDEARYLDEWVRFHMEQGFEKFYLFDDGSTDNPIEVLKPFMLSGAVKLKPTSALRDYYARQVDANNAALRLAKNECSWLAFLDIDEFLFSPEGEIREVLPRSFCVAAVFVWWRLFGSSGHKEPPSQGAIESYVMTAPFPTTRVAARKILIHNDLDFFDNPSRPASAGTLHGKSIVRPKWILRAGIHAPRRYVGKITEEGGRRVFWSSFVARFFPRIARRTKAWFWVPTQEKLRINHYWSKSIAELEAKSVRSEAFRGHRTIRDYLERDEGLNQVEDRTIFKKLGRSIG